LGAPAPLSPLSARTCCVNGRSCLARDDDASPAREPLASGPVAEQGGDPQSVDPVIPKIHESLVIAGTALDPRADRRDDAIFQQTLFSRDDQILQSLAAGINASLV
jgi:hypothetical protein